MRIIGGKWRGRVLVAPEGRAVRPTSDRAREAVFNMLLHRFEDEDWSLEGARVVDAFAGSGAMGLEALSRGAAHATFIDNARDSVTAIRANAHALDLLAAADIVTADATRPPRTVAPCSLAFLDPPYELDIARDALAALAGAGWLAPGALCVVEVKATSELVPPPDFRIEDERVHGKARIVFLRWKKI